MSCEKLTGAEAVPASSPAEERGTTDPTIAARTAKRRDDTTVFTIPMILAASEKLLLSSAGSSGWERHRRSADVAQGCPLGLPCERVSLSS